MKRSVQVLVEEHDEIPEGCSMIFEAVGPARAVSRVIYEDAEWSVTAAFSGRVAPAMVVPVSDSGAGTSYLVYGGDLGLRLKRDDGAEAAEPYLLLEQSAVF